MNKYKTTEDYNTKPTCCDNASIYINRSVPRKKSRFINEVLDCWWMISEEHVQYHSSPRLKLKIMFCPFCGTKLPNCCKGIKKQ